MEIEYTELSVRTGGKERLLDLNTHGSQGWIICSPLREIIDPLAHLGRPQAFLEKGLFYRKKSK